MKNETQHGDDERLSVNRKAVRQTRRGGQTRDSREARERPEPRVAQETQQASTRAMMQYSVLPNPPPIPGWHLCWCSTNNPSDPIYGRMRMGYVPVKTEEIPGFDSSLNLKTGDYAGHFGCNEMVLMKIKQERYQQIMTDLHHDEPNREEAATRATVDALEEELARNKTQLVREGGFAKSDNSPRPRPVFAG